MDVKLFSTLQKKYVRPFNELTGNGLAVSHMKHVEKYVDDVFRCAAKGFPEGIEYLGYRRCTPLEAFNVVTRKRSNSNRSFEMTKSFMYLVEYQFRYFGDQIENRYLFLPYVEDAGIIKILGSVFSISPVIADIAISVMIDSLFIPVGRDKLEFKRLLHPVMANGERDMYYVVWSNIHHQSNAKGQDRSVKPIVKMNGTPAHYLFCKYGVREAFKRYFNVEVVVGQHEIIRTDYPSSEWMIFESAYKQGGKPRGHKLRFYTASQIRLAIRVKDFNPGTQGMIAAFFYLVDHFPDRISVEEIDDTVMWRVLMGHIYLEPNISEGKMLIGINAHIDSSDGYIDFMAKEDLEKAGVYVNDLYELFAYIIETMPERIAQAGTDVASMNGKKLTILRYVLKDISHAIFNLMFEMKKKSKNGTKQLTPKDIREAMQKYLKPELAHRINKDHREASSISSPTDNKLFKITAQIVPQSQSSGGVKGKNSKTMNDPALILHSSIAENGSLNNLPKSEPTGRSRLNPYVQLGPDGKLLRDPLKVKLLDDFQRAIER